MSPPLASGGAHRVGRFELRRQLGKGGCGIVFLAFDPKLEREVALKIPRPEMMLSADARRRLIREALAAAEFDHPNLVPVYESGEIGPVCFIATAFCPGQTLGEWLEKQAFPVPVRQAARLVATLAEAVQHAHDRAVLHRDLKPNNVILQDVREDPHQQESPVGSCQLRGEQYIPRIVDFGLAKLLERGGPSETATSQVLGTPKYMAPEQAQARHADVGPTADVYALGVILYEMLTGRAPFEGETDVEVLRQAIQGELTQPRHLRPDIPRDLEAICLKAMSRTPAKRYRTAIDFADDLRRFLDGKPTLARPLKWLGRAARWLRRNDQAVALTTVTTIAALLLAFGMFSNYTTRQLRSERETSLRDQAERTREEQRREYARRVHEAYLAWRSGDLKAAAVLLEAAAKLARNSGETTDFPHGYLTRLIAGERLAIACPAGPITSLARSPDGNFLASGHRDGSLSLWKASTGTEIRTVAAHPAAIAALRFNGPNQLTSCDTSRSCKNWLVSSTGVLTLEPDRVGNIELPKTNFPAVRLDDTFITGGEDGIIRSWNIPMDEQLVTVEKLASPVLALASSADGSRILVATENARVLAFSGLTRQEILPTPAGGLMGLHLSRAFPGMALMIKNGVVIGEDLTGIEGRERFRLPPVNGALTAAVISGDGGSVAVGDERGRVTVWNIRDQSKVVSVTLGDNVPVRKLAISEDGLSIAAHVGDRIIVQVIKELGSRIRVPAEAGTLFRFAPDGNRVVTTGRKGVLQVWSTYSGQEEFTLYGHSGQVTGLAISPNGRTLVSGGVTGEIKFWDLRVGQEIMSFSRHQAPVTTIEFSSSGKYLITAGSELAIWPVAKAD